MPLRYPTHGTGAGKVKPINDVVSARTIAPIFLYGGVLFGKKYEDEQYHLSGKA